MSLGPKHDRAPLTTSVVTAVDNGTAMRGEDVQDVDRRRAVKDPGSTLIAARRVTAARKKVKLKRPGQPVVGETASARMRW
jgi:hypothetical protein